ncbi:mitochondrial inner membrane protease ATP23 [Cryphonectria parasitica EP155]|uniref:Mitochondrial inner membrane protease ATP23 n=1 Tax=Cryphonectria parasitica (strain ATCC 38755 / EP155) TaxID=660469 RepID=A0A9P4YAS4_CRYP1|nr:mitochondrial inner membrane protease ATP23 [Cryphonectria parasitica EP155]KAF3769600.1 mitochondrial inner membrane protease ATP23 [Cryphonectria parasitica EP155]
MTSPSSSSSSSNSSPSRPNLYLENDPARTGFDPSTSWWLNYFHILTGRVTPEGIFHYRESRSRVHEARDVERCEQFRDWLLRYSPTVTFLNDRIAELNHGRKMDAANILCRRCPARLTADGHVERQGGGFEPTHGILVCANEIRNRGHLEDILSHEMVHAYDELRFEVDFRGQRDLKQAACTEIRASMLSGECRFTREFWTRNNWRLTEQFQDCVRRRAVQSMMARPWVKNDVQAVKVVNEVWDSCFSDTRPFNEVYR